MPWILPNPVLGTTHRVPVIQCDANAICTSLMSLILLCNLRQDKAPLFTGAAKVDLSANGDACCVGKIQLPAGRHGGEFQFVPASSSELPAVAPCCVSCSRSLPRVGVKPRGLHVQG